MDLADTIYAVPQLQDQDQPMLQYGSKSFFFCVCDYNCVIYSACLLSHPQWSICLRARAWSVVSTHTLRFGGSQPFCRGRINLISLQRIISKTSNNEIREVQKNRKAIRSFLNKSYLLFFSSSFCNFFLLSSPHNATPPLPRPFLTPLLFIQLYCALFIAQLTYWICLMKTDLTAAPQ